jgi:hypothetical protein
MTVQELIEKLQQMPPFAPVVLNMDRSELTNGHKVVSVSFEMVARRNCDGSYTGMICGDDGDYDEYYQRAAVVSIISSSGNRQVKALP